MKNHAPTQPPSLDAAALRSALASPLRMEIAGLLAADTELSVSDMSRLTGRPATSLYHHLAVLEDAGILVDAGTRPKGKRFEKIYRCSSSAFELELDPTDKVARAQVAQTVAAAFRMARRDFEAALDREDLCAEGPARNMFTFRLHMRASTDFLAQLNERIRAIEELLGEHACSTPEPKVDDQFLSVTFAMLPLPGRSTDKSPTLT